jgi:hypothetical protein
MPDEPEEIEWTGDNFADVRDFCRRESDGFSVVVYREGGTLYLDVVGGTEQVQPGARIRRTGPDSFTATHSA